VAFHLEYHRFLKEGVLHDNEHSAALGKLLRFGSTALEEGKTTSLAEYVGRMPEGQREIHYLLASSREAAESSPYFEACRSRHYEALILSDPVDEFVVERLGEHDGKRIVSVEKAQLTVEEPQGTEGLGEEPARELAGWMQERLGAGIKEVRVSNRLVDSPAVVVERDPHLTSTMRRTLRAMRQGMELPAPEQDLEINPRHAVIRRLNQLRGQDPELAAKVAEQILDGARMAAGMLEDPRAMLRRMHELLERVLPQ
jgi:molecular chaperone HtpG